MYLERSKKNFNIDTLRKYCPQKQIVLRKTLYLENYKLAQSR